jgi:hypothetical protein
MVDELSHAFAPIVQLRRGGHDKFLLQHATGMLPAQQFHYISTAAKIQGVLSSPFSFCIGTFQAAPPDVLLACTGVMPS